MGLELLLQKIEQNEEITPVDLNMHIDSNFFDLGKKSKKNKSEKTLISIYSTYLKEKNISFDSARIYLSEQGILDFRNVTQIVTGKRSSFKKISRGFGSITGLWKGKKSGPDTRRLLVEHNLLSGDLSTYENPHLEDILWHSFQERSVAKDYFNPEVVGEDLTEKNRKLLFDRGIAKKYLLENKIIDFRDIIATVDGKNSFFRNISQGFGSVTGLLEGQKTGPDTRRLLVEHNLLSGDLSTYETHHLEEILWHSFNEKSVAKDYFNPEVVGKDLAEKNKQILRESQPFKEYLKEKNINLLEPSKDPILSLAGYEPKQRNFQVIQPAHRMISSNWDDDVDTLIDMLTDIPENERLTHLKLEEEKYEELFGRTLFAIILKAESVGLLPFKERWTQNNSDGRPIVYPLPSQRTILDEGGLLYLRNEFALLENKDVPKEIDVFAFTSPGHEQFRHIITPVPYKGIYLEDYSLFEQEILLKLNSYAANPLERTLQKDVRILANEDPEIRNVLYSQILVRNVASKNTQHFDTTEIDLNGKTLLVYNQETPVSFRDFRPKNNA